MEFQLHDDPANYVARPIFGKFDARGFATVTAIVVCLAPLLYASFRFSWNSALTSLLSALIAGPIGVVGFGKLHGLHVEKFVPLMLCEHKAPHEMLWSAPLVKITHVSDRRHAQKPTRKEKKVARADTKAQKSESSEDAVLAQKIISDK